MAKGFKDSKGNFHPTGRKQMSKREKTLRSAGIPIDDFDSSFLRTSKGDRQLAERTERQRMKKIEADKEQRRVDRLEDAITELERKHGDQLILGVNNPLTDQEWVDLNNLLVDEVEAQFDKDIKVKDKKIEDMMNRLPFNDIQALREVQSENGLRKMTLEDHKRHKQSWQDELNRGNYDLEGEPTPHLTLQMFKELPDDQKLLGDDGVVTTKYAVSDMGLTPDEIEDYESDGKSYSNAVEDSVFYYRPYFGQLDFGDKVDG